MYYSTKNSLEKVIHTDLCPHRKEILSKNLIMFKTSEDAYKKGYRLCKRCNMLTLLYKREFSQILTFCRSNPIMCNVDDKFLYIYTPHSSWRIVPVSTTETTRLYHRNTQVRGENEAIPGFHHQKVHYKSIVEYLDYIVGHEYYRLMHPITDCVEKPDNTPPKGSKRYKKNERKAKNKARNSAARHVIDLINSLYN